MKHRSYLISDFSSVAIDRTRSGEYRWRSRFGYWVFKVSTTPGYKAHCGVLDPAGKIRLRYETSQNVYTYYEPQISKMPELLQAIVLEGNHD